MNINQFPIVKTFSYADYLAFCENLVAQNANSGLAQSEALANFTKLNVSRMKRVYKTFLPDAKVVESLRGSSASQWFVITESWCGDAAQSLPVFARLAETLPEVKINIVLRDENPELIDAFLTNGGRSIPKVLFTNETGEIIHHWGPRPQVLQQLFLKEHNAGIPHEQSVLMLQEWYNNDKGQHVSQEVAQLLS
jgi:thiol-disulfide isomerase/thioredoxin